ncbi:MAG TPA: ATP-dependent DNA ligase [Povalibacter sp.]|uniref:ATP-dependent DNA ligase n=1 Tax=Povalibacter sp. TaxID=1962978 RepID=UPI002C024CFC|nr:ATP-dependent DNA ligase [Povalibacter sp.]HMN46287.1 ATP-dependent DNA ligase [Povalibacter sp.]
MLFADLVAASARVAATRSRLAKLRELAQCLQALAPDEIEIGVLWLAGETRQGKIGVGYSVLQPSAQVAPAVPATLTLRDVDDVLTLLQGMRGAGSAARRKSILGDLLGRATADEQSFLLRLLVGELRQGALAGLMVDAIAEAAKLPVADVRRASMYSGHVGGLAHVALTQGLAGLERFRIEVLSPIAPMLAQTATDVADALEQLSSDVAFEWKVDGARVQVHKAGDEVRVYTRSLNDVTAAVPEVVEAVRTIDARQIVLDGETVALDATGRPLPFQVTMRRFGRKLDVDALRAELPLHVYFFDCLLLDEESLADRPARERFAAMERVLPESIRIPRLATRDVDVATDFYDRALASGHEGVMAKSLDSAYEAGSRGASWLKIKHVHTLDLVVLAAEWGSGRRKGWLSNLHLGARDPASGGFVMLGKTFKGLTDAMLEWQTKEFLARETHRDSYTVHVRPEMVVEIAFNDIQASSQYEGGYALRFARVKAYRPDKPVEQADTIEEIRRIYTAQGPLYDPAASPSPN